MVALPPTLDDVDLCADRLPPGRVAGVVPVVPAGGPGHQQLGGGARAGLLRLQADAAPGGVEVQDLMRGRGEEERRLTSFFFLRDLEEENLHSFHIGASNLTFGKFFSSPLFLGGRRTFFDVG